MSAVPQNRQRLISSQNALLLGGVLAAAMVLGSFFDLQISHSLYNPDSPFGIFGAAFGEWPASLGLLAAGSLFVLAPAPRMTAAAIALRAAGVLIYALGLVMAVMMPLRYIASPKPVIIVIGLVVAGLVTWGIYAISRGGDRGTMLRVATVIFVVILIEMVLINVIKIGWERPRMRLLEENGSVDFVSWWLPGAVDRSALGAIESEEFKSFPSGHTANSATLIMLTALIPLRAAWERYAGVFFWTGCIWAGFVAVSRIIMGAHFLTDVTAGLAITFVIILAAYRIAFGKDRKERVLDEN